MTPEPPPTPVHGGPEGAPRAGPSPGAVHAGPFLGGFSLTKDDTTWAMLAHALTFVEGGLIGPLVLYIVKKDQSPFVAFHALQSFYFGLLFFAIGIGTCGIGLLLLLVPYFVYEIVALREAHEGRWYKLPIAGSWAWKKHPGPGA